MSKPNKVYEQNALAVMTVLDDLLDKTGAVIIITKTTDNMFCVKVMWKDELVDEALGGANSLFVALDEARQHMENQLDANRIDELLSMFVDLINEHGLDSQQVASFREEYQENAELIALMDETLLLHSAETG